jgi:hypothetical protein
MELMYKELEKLEEREQPINKQTELSQLLPTIEQIKGYLDYLSKENRAKAEALLPDYGQRRAKAIELAGNVMANRAELLTLLAQSKADSQQVIALIPFVVRGLVKRKLEENFNKIDELIY